MPLTKVTFAPGVVKDDTPLASEGTWVDADWIRFRRGQAQTMGGWELATVETVTGKARGAKAWADLTGEPILGIGTHSKLYAYYGGGLYDVTPSGFTAGLEDGTGGAGYGTGTYSTGTYSTSSAGDYLPLVWSIDNFGENMLAVPRGGTLYQWDASTPSTIAAAVSGAPAKIETMFVTPEAIIVACGATDSGSTYDPMLVRWSDQQSATTWTASDSNLAGEEALANGTKIVRGLVSRGQNLIWTDTALYGMQYLQDSGLVFDFQLLGTGCGLIGANAAAEKDGIAFWLSNSGQFYLYSGGGPQVIDCPVRRYVFDNLAPSQEEKIFCWVNSQFNEVWWVYPDTRDGDEVSRYVAFNFVERHWTIGTINRTAWVDAGVWPHPVGIGADGYLWFHERGITANGGNLSASLTSGFFDLGDGENLVAVRRIVPDFDDQQGAVSMAFKTRLWPNGAETDHGPYTATPTTEKLDMRVTGRQMAVSLSSDAIGSFWRAGALRYDIVPSGSRR